MKTTLLSLVAVLIVCAACDTHDVRIEKKQLPTDAQTLLDNYFSDRTIAYIIKEKDDASIEYEVMFTDGTQIEFDKNGCWKEIKCQPQVPSALIPEPILSYVQTQYPGVHIIGIDRGDHAECYEIKLDKGIALMFDKDGAFMYINS